ncbi:rRNA methyltransferase 3, mitochondrial isoform X1 [Melitaea cinxia]|uniref:rRNA methyltransferase 3, mitochondrial isoform X1 n=2 Tax=Melitaea cinxia TaxID=113334 RepID=UPI001E27435E|nr:rRNA methyltransferase 3, mitochondrial isoform X1 [Melitaea cinxia]
MSRNIYSLSNFFLQQIPKLPSVRLYGRWMHRRPAKVLLPFEPNSNVNLKEEHVIDIGAEGFKKSNENYESKEKKPPAPVTSQEKFKEIKAKKEMELKKKKFYLSQKKVFDDNGDVIYEKLKGNDGRISNLLVKLKSKKERLRAGQMLVEGWRLIVDGLEANCVLKYVIFSRTEDLNNLRPFLPKTGVQFYKIPYNDISIWSDVETSPGIFGVFEIPNADSIKRYAKPIPLQLICDNIRTPGNLGAILRAAVGVGSEKVLLTKGCVDLWDPKVIRSASGAHFRQPIHHSVDWEELPKLLEADTSIFIADNNINVLDIHENQNVLDSIPVVPYYGVDFANLKHVTLIIGGETEGISENSYRLAANKNGLRLNIPLHKGVDSLNTGMAAAVIAFEVKKQFIQAWAKLKLNNKKNVIS